MGWRYCYLCEHLFYIADTIPYCISPKGTGLQQLSSLLPLGTHVDNSTILPSAGLQPATVNGDESCYRPDGPAVTLFPWAQRQALSRDNM